MMKVIVNNEVYLMHWETRKFSPTNGKNTEMELEATDCIIRKVFDVDGKPSEVARGHVSQTACDQANSVLARKLSFLKAIEGMKRPIRKALGHEYHRTCRVVPMSSGQKNRRLKKRISEVQKALALANSMISSGESHSERSEKQIKEALV